MQRTTNMLSLGEWPQANIRQKNIELTPITKRILSQVHLQAEQLLPIIFQKFLHLHSSNDFQVQLQRRRKQVQILTEIRNNYIMGKDYGPFIQKIPFELQKQIKKLRVHSKCSAIYLKSIEPNRSQNLLTELSRIKSQKSTKSKELGICSRVKSREKTNRKQNIQHQQPFYFGTSNKNTNSSHQKRHKLHSKIGSTQLRSQACKSKNHSTQQQYGYSYIPNHVNSKQSNLSNLPQKRNEGIRSQKFLCQGLLKSVQKWQKLKQHAAEMERLQGPSIKEKSAKIHLNQKVQVQNHTKPIKKRMNSESKSFHCRYAYFF